MSTVGWLAVLASVVAVWLLTSINDRLARVIKLLEIANEELRYPNLEAHKRDMMGQRAYNEMNEML
jgi:cytidylate kinase